MYREWYLLEKCDVIISLCHFQHHLKFVGNELKADTDSYHLVGSLYLWALR